MFKTIKYVPAVKNFIIKWALIIAPCILVHIHSFAQVGISTTSITPDASSILELRSTSAGFLPPRMTTTQRDAIVAPATGLLIYNTTTSQLNYYTSSWQVIAGSTGTGEIATPANSAANNTYTDNATYWGYATVANGFPIDGTLSGIRKGTINTQYLQGAATANTYVRYWNNGTAAWSAWFLFLDSQDFTAKGDMIIATSANTTANLPAGANGTVLTADNTTATGLKWAVSTPEITGVTNASVNTAYTDNKTYWSRVLTTDGFPVTGFLSGTRKGTAHTQRIQSETGERTFSRYWIEGSTAWNTWIEYVQADDYTSKGALVAGTGTNAFATLAPGANGTILQADNSTATGLKWASGQTIVTLGTDVANNSTPANTIADVTGLSFPVTAGVTYRFKALVIYTSAALTTGSRWSISGPASPTLLSYKSYYPLTATSETVNAVSGYDLPAASNTTSVSLAGNIATIEGIIKPSASGTVAVRFASEVAGSAITAKAGSTLTWW